MTYETRELTGSAFKNRKKEKESQPDLTGEAKIEGKIYWLSVWIRKDKNGNDWASISLQEKDFTKAKDAVKASPGPSVPTDFSDEIPFSKMETP